MSSHAWTWAASAHTSRFVICRGVVRPDFITHLDPQLRSELGSLHMSSSLCIAESFNDTLKRIMRNYKPVREGHAGPLVKYAGGA